MGRHNFLEVKEQKKKKNPKERLDGVLPDRTLLNNGTW